MHAVTGDDSAVATMLGYHPDHTARLLTEAGATWSRYAAGDHTPR